MPKYSEWLIKKPGSTWLIVVLHGFNGSPETIEPVVRFLDEHCADADRYVPPLPLGVFSFVDPNRLVREHVAAIDAIWAGRAAEGLHPYDKVVIVGYSAGGLLARKIYVCGCGETADAPFERELRSRPEAPEPTHPWASSVERVVLLAALNRGWSISHHFHPTRAVLYTVGQWILNFVGLFTGKAIMSRLKRGQPFVTQLRIQWIQMRRHAGETRPGKALTVQLLGTIDDLVSPEDNLDLIAGSDFVYLDVPYSGHSSVVAFNEQTPVAPANAAGRTTVGKLRQEQFRKALLLDEADLRALGAHPSDEQNIVQDEGVDQVVFVVHGIRDEGYWTQKVARHIVSRARRAENQVRIATETSSYGFFPMLPFFLPSRRKEKVEWLMDQYAEAIARYPKAKISFVGHSNGTYLLAKALSQYPCCRFHNVVFAGSVVQTRYDWAVADARGQVNKVLNYVATRDWVVAIFPKAVEMVGLPELGSAGHDGFVAGDSNLISNVEYVVGSHSAALDERNWDAIADFILSGRHETLPSSMRSAKRPLLATALGRAAPLLWIAGVAIIAALVLGLWHLPIAEWQRTLLIVLFLFAIWKVITKF